MKINVPHIAKLANITLSKTEKEKLQKDLEETLSYVDKLNSIDTSSVDPTNQVGELENIFREDNTTPCLSIEDALKNAKSVRSGMFKIKAILDS